MKKTFLMRSSFTFASRSWLAMLTMMVGTQKMKLMGWVARNSTSLAGKVAQLVGNNHPRGAFGDHRQNSSV